MCYPVCVMVHIKEPLLLIRKSSPCSGGSEFTLSLSEWFFTICLMHIFFGQIFFCVYVVYSFSQLNNIELFINLFSDFQLKSVLTNVKKFQHFLTSNLSLPVDDVTVLLNSTIAVKEVCSKFNIYIIQLVSLDFE